MTSLDVDIALVGGGGAAHCLLDAFATAGLDGLRIAVLDPVQHKGNDRTWCFWDDGVSPIEPAVSHRWSTLRVVAANGAEHRLDLAAQPPARRGAAQRSAGRGGARRRCVTAADGDGGRIVTGAGGQGGGRGRPASYALVRSADFYALAADRASRFDVTWIAEPVLSIVDRTGRATVRTSTRTVRARWVFDSRPLPPSRPGVTMLWQHFRGWWVRDGRFDPEVATLMDFAVPQPADGLAFGYLLPVSTSRALVEYTVFSRDRLAASAYEAALRSWYGLAAVESTEAGAIPMTDAVFPRRAGRRVFRVGTGGGATRPATGYTFHTMLRQTAGIAARLAAGHDPVPAHPYPRRHRLYDAILLRALDRRYVDGRALLTDLLTTQPPARVLGFLDGTTGPRAELAILTGTPMAAMARATVSCLAARAVPQPGSAGTGVG